MLQKSMICLKKEQDRCKSLQEYNTSLIARVGRLESQVQTASYDPSLDSKSATISQPSQQTKQKRKKRNKKNKTKPTTTDDGEEDIDAYLDAIAKASQEEFDAKMRSIKTKQAFECCMCEPRIFFKDEDSHWDHMRDFH